MLQKQLSVIIPNYNYAHLLERRINSIINQTVKPAEIIFLDDCSTDNSLEIAEQLLSQSPIPYKIFSNQNNQGIFKQWLKGIELAQYDYFWIAETDDYCELNFIEELLPIFNDPAVVMAYCCSIFVTGDNYDKIYDIASKNNLFNTSRWNNDFIANAKEEVETYYSVSNVSPNASAIIFNKKLLDFSPIKSEMNKFSRAGDWIFYILLLEQNPGFKIAYSSQQLNFYYRHEQSAWMHSESLKDSRLLNESLLIYIHCLTHFNISVDTKHKIINLMANCLINYQINTTTEKLINDISNFINMTLLILNLKEKHEIELIALEQKNAHKNKQIEEQYTITALQLNESQLELNETKLELDRIKSSKGWRLLTLIRKVRAKIMAKFKFDK